MTLTPTPTDHELARSYRFPTLSTALDYAAKGATGCNYFGRNGELRAAVSYRSLRHSARNIARRLNGLRIDRGARVVLVAETDPMFHAFFFACQYVGLVPVPVAPPLQLGGAEDYVRHLNGLLIASGARLCIGPAQCAELMHRAADGLGLDFVGSAQEFFDIAPAQGDLQPTERHEFAYLQFTSGSTQFPRGVAITQSAVMSNLEYSLERLALQPTDRAVSWLPYYHDMGLVGLVLAPLVSQMSVDYLGSREFAMRPRQWLVRMSESRATISFAPPFGYELCARRLRHDDISSLDLSAWRVAGVGAEPIRTEGLESFARLVEPCGFKQTAFVASYGLAEAALAVTITPLNIGLRVDHLASNCVANNGENHELNDRDDEPPSRAYVNCGRALRDHEIEVRDKDGQVLPARHIGLIFVRGPSVMSGYMRESMINATPSELAVDGWLNTGDLGYMVDGDLIVTGREKDLIIVNGRNIWPQDLEYLIESLPDVRPGDSSAFSMQLDDGRSQAVVVVQYRMKDSSLREGFIQRVRQAIMSAYGIDCLVDLVPLHTIARTSSGKLSRYKTRIDFLKRRSQQALVEGTTAA